MPIKLADVREGDTLIADAGFTCIPQGPCKVQKDTAGNLYIKCSNGNHLLDGQVEHGYLIGLTRPS